MTNGKKGSLGSHAVFSALSNNALSPLSLSLSLARSVCLSCALSTVAYAVNVISNACIIKMQASATVLTLSLTSLSYSSLPLHSSHSSLFSVYLFNTPFLPLTLSLSLLHTPTPHSTSHSLRLMWHTFGLHRNLLA